MLSEERATGTLRYVAPMARDPTLVPAAQADR
jgi:hypothetical protein